MLVEAAFQLNITKLSQIQIVTNHADSQITTSVQHNLTAILMLYFVCQDIAGVR